MLNKTIFALTSLLLVANNVIAGTIITPPTNQIPEPSIIALLGLGGAAYAFIAWKNKK
ncbi:MAG: hypothetical protein COB62_02245 [Piscirickettsiaceae bacterium]|nr:MAG: hypothetical protein COB62_02245 [Piscirickettsiaceae bacterium]